MASPKTGKEKRMTTANEMLIKTLCKDGCKLNTSTFSKAAGTVSHTTLTGVTATAAELNKLSGAGAAVPSGTQHAHVTDGKVDYTTGNLDIEAEVIAAFNTTNGKINSILAALEAFGINASS